MQNLAAVVGQEQLEGAIRGLQHFKFAQYVTLASFVLLVYDTLLTLSDEIALVWPSKWRLPKFLFFYNRYIAFGDVFMLLYVLAVGGSSSFCVISFRTLGWFSSSGFVVAQVILMMRTWAIWEHNKKVTAILLSLLLIGLGIDIYVVFRYLMGVSAMPSITSAIDGCLLHFSNRIVFGDFLIVIVNETTMLVLLVVKALQHFKHARSTLMVRMYHDGIFYYTFILASSIANLITIFAAPMELHNVLIVIQRVLHSIFCSRVLLHIRGAYTQPYNHAYTDDTDTRAEVSVAFRQACQPYDGGSASNQRIIIGHAFSANSRTSGIFSDVVQLSPLSPTRSCDEEAMHNGLTSPRRETQEESAARASTSSSVKGKQPQSSSHSDWSSPIEGSSRDATMPHLPHLHRGDL